MSKRRTNPDFINGVPELLALRLLSRKPMYGYELVQQIKLCTAGALEFGEGCVYPVLHRLETEKLLTSQRATINGRSRIVYRVTPGGRKRLAESTGVWRQLVEAVQNILEDRSDARPAVA